MSQSIIGLIIFTKLHFHFLVVTSTNVPIIANHIKKFSDNLNGDENSLVNLHQLKKDDRIMILLQLLQQQLVDDDDNTFKRISESDAIYIPKVLQTTFENSKVQDNESSIRIKESEKMSKNSTTSEHVTIHTNDVLNRDQIDNRQITNYDNIDNNWIGLDGDLEGVSKKTSLDKPLPQIMHKRPNRLIYDLNDSNNRELAHPLDIILGNESIQLIPTKSSTLVTRKEENTSNDINASSTQSEWDVGNGNKNKTSTVILTKYIIQNKPQFDEPISQTTMTEKPINFNIKTEKVNIPDSNVLNNQRFENPSDITTENKRYIYVAPGKLGTLDKLKVHNISENSRDLDLQSNRHLYNNNSKNKTNTVVITKYFVFDRSDADEPKTQTMTKKLTNINTEKTVAYDFNEPNNQKQLQGQISAVTTGRKSIDSTFTRLNALDTQKEDNILNDSNTSNTQSNLESEKDNEIKTLKIIINESKITKETGSDEPITRTITIKPENVKVMTNKAKVYDSNDINNEKLENPLNEMTAKESFQLISTKSSILDTGEKDTILKDENVLSTEPKLHLDNDNMGKTNTIITKNSIVRIKPDVDDLITQAIGNKPINLNKDTEKIRIYESKISNNQKSDHSFDEKSTYLIKTNIDNLINKSSETNSEGSMIEEIKNTEKKKKHFEELKDLENQSKSFTLNVDINKASKFHISNESSNKNLEHPLDITTGKEIIHSIYTKSSTRSPSKDDNILNKNYILSTPSNLNLDKHNESGITIAIMNESQVPYKSQTNELITPIITKRPSKSKVNTEKITIYDSNNKKLKHLLDETKDIQSIYLTPTTPRTLDTQKEDNTKVPSTRSNLFIGKNSEGKKTSIIKTKSNLSNKPDLDEPIPQKLTKTPINLNLKTGTAEFFDYNEPNNKQLELPSDVTTGNYSLYSESTKSNTYETHKEYNTLSDSTELTTQPNLTLTIENESKTNTIIMKEPKNAFIEWENLSNKINHVSELNSQINELNYPTTEKDGSNLITQPSTQSIKLNFFEHPTERSEKSSTYDTHKEDHLLNDSNELSTRPNPTLEIENEIKTNAITMNNLKGEPENVFNRWKNRISQINHHGSALNVKLNELNYPTIEKEGSYLVTKPNTLFIEPNTFVQLTKPSENIDSNVSNKNEPCAKKDSNIMTDNNINGLTKIESQNYNYGSGSNVIDLLTALTRNPITVDYSTKNSETYNIHDFSITTTNERTRDKQTNPLLIFDNSKTNVLNWFILTKT